MKNMKALIITLASVCALSLLAATPTVEQDDVTMTQSGRKVLITYTLRNAPAIITVDIQTNDATAGWVSIGAENFTSLVGEVNKIVRTLDTPLTVTWSAKSDWPDHTVDGGKIRAVVKAWALDCPPDYLVADLMGDKMHKFYVSEAAIPNGVHAAEYKTSKMVFRRIPASGVTWRMGAPASEAPGSQSKAGTTIKYADQEIPHYVGLSDDYYMAIYPVTQYQCKLLIGAYRNGTKSGVSETDDDFIYTPANKLNFSANLRGSGVEPDSNMIVGKMRNATGLTGIDVPSDAQWEYACRAGTSTKFSCGDTLDGRYAWNSNNAEGKIRPVGERLPNPWGLYDMHGNVCEWTYDWWEWGDYYTQTFGTAWAADHTVTVVDPLATADNWGKGYGTQRGGAFNNVDFDCRSSRRQCYARNSVGEEGIYGARLCCPAVFE